MKATGEVMAIGRTFESALHKAVRSLEVGKKTLLWEDPKWGKEPGFEGYPLYPNDLRLWALMGALRRGMTDDDACRTTGIDPWFIQKLRNILDKERQLLGVELTPELMRSAKRMGFSDDTIGVLADRLPEQVREQRKQWGIVPVYKTVDTCAAEFAAETPYFYSTYEKENEATPIPDKKAVVIGSGPIRIGQGIEFDYCCVHSAWALQEMGLKSIIVNSNPETVSTDFDTSDRLYFEALDEESVRNILENEGQDTSPSIVQFGGQTAINMAGPLSHANLPILGSGAEPIDVAEDRRRFEDFLERLGIPQPPGAGVTTIEEALGVARGLGYPLLVRPSYVLGGRAMEIVYNETELIRYLVMALELDSKHPVLIDKYLFGKEVEVDAICDGEEVLIPGVMEHIERAGVHSGDSIAVYPGVNLTEGEVNTMIDYTVRIGVALGVRGLINVQMVIVREGGKSSVFILEVNPRSSRTVPFMSKVTGVPMVKLATKVMAGMSLKEQGYRGGLWKKSKLVGIKAPVFSMSKLTGVDNYLGPEMKSTGEVMGIDFDFPGALTKALMASGLMLSPHGSMLLSIADRDKSEAVPLVKRLHEMEYSLYATEGTAAMIAALGMPVKMVTKKLSEGHPNVLDVIRDGSVKAVVNTITGGRLALKDGFSIRRAAVERRIPCYTSLDTLKVVLDAVSAAGRPYNVESMATYLKRKK
jgi:carbamoyl-phosphate synthase large subunit